MTKRAPQESSSGGRRDRGNPGDSERGSSGRGADPHRAFMISILTLVTLTAGLHVAGALALKDSFWGVHLYAFFHPFLLVLVTVILLGGSVLIALNPRSVADRLCARFEVSWWRRFPATLTAAITVGSASILWLARSRHTYLGDGNVLINTVPAGQSFHPHQPLTMLAQQKMYAMAGGLFSAGERADDRVATDAVALGSVIAGVVFIGVAWMLARELAVLAFRRKPDPHSQPQADSGRKAGDARRAVVFLTTLILLTQGYVQLFFGYVENYTFYAVAIGLYLWLALRTLRGASPLALPAFALLLGLGLHLSAAMLLPSFAVLGIYVFMTPGKRLRGMRDLAIAGVLLFGLDRALAAAQPGYHMLGELADVAGKALTRSQEGAPGYMLSSVHLRDFLNEQFLIGPLGIFIFVAALATVLIRRAGRGVEGIFFGVAGATYVTVGWLAGDSNLGYARNWDLLAPGALLVTVAGLGLFFSLGNGRRALPALVCALMLSLYHTVPWVATNASSQRSFERLKTLPLGRGRTEVLVGKWYSQHGSLDDAGRWFERAIQIEPRNNNAHYLLGLVHWDQGDMPRAAEAFAQAVRLRQDKVLFRERLIEALRASDQYQATLPHIEFVLKQKPGDVDQWIFYGEALQSVDREEQANTAFRKAVSLYQPVWEQDPGGFRTNSVYGILYGNLGEYERALSYFERALDAEPDSDSAHYYAGYTLYVLDRLEEAAGHFTRCLELNPTHPERTDMEEWIREGGG